jgi:hypothetical protein
MRLCSCFAGFRQIASNVDEMTFAKPRALLRRCPLVQLSRKLPRVCPLLWQAMSSFASSAALDEMFGAFAAARKGYAQAAAMGWLLQRHAVVSDGGEADAAPFAAHSGSHVEAATSAGQCPLTKDARAADTDRSREGTHIKPSVPAQELQEADVVVRLAESTDGLRAGVALMIEFGLPN